MDFDGQLSADFWKARSKFMQSARPYSPSRDINHERPRLDFIGGLEDAHGFAAPPQKTHPMSMEPAIRTLKGNRSRYGADGQRNVALPLRAAHRALQMPVASGLMPLAAGCGPSAELSVERPVLGSNEALLVYCTKGEGWCEIDGYRHRVAWGDLCVIPPESRLRYGADQAHSWNICWVHAAGSNLGFFLQQLRISRQQPLIKIGENLRVLGWMFELIELLGAAHCAAELLYASQTLAHLLSAVACRPRDQRRAAADASDRIERTIEYMRQHLDEPVRAGTLAAMANMSLPQYFAAFKRFVGTSPINYFTKLRMEQARRLLAETPWSVKEIASSLGYEDALYFSRVFKSVTSAPPSHYRLQLRATS